MDEILSILVKLAGTVLAGLLIYLCTKLKTWVADKIAEIKDEHLRELIKSFAESAEQTLKADDPTGEKRMERVKSLLEEAGFEINDIVNSLIEAAVYNINLNNPLLEKDED